MNRNTTTLLLKGSYALLHVDCTEMCVASACTQPSYNDKNPSSVLFLITFSPVSNRAVSGLVLVITQ